HTPSVPYTLSLHDALPIYVVDDVPRYGFHDRRSRSPLPSYSTPQRDSDRRPRCPSSSHRKPKPPTDQYFYYNQVPAYDDADQLGDRKSTRLNSSHVSTSYA